jgi:hypothetical protein
MDNKGNVNARAMVGVWSMGMAVEGEMQLGQRDIGTRSRATYGDVASDIILNDDKCGVTEKTYKSVSFTLVCAALQ